MVWVGVSVGHPSNTSCNCALNLNGALSALNMDTSTKPSRVRFDMHLNVVKLTVACLEFQGLIGAHLKRAI